MAILKLPTPLTFTPGFSQAINYFRQAGSHLHGRAFGKRFVSNDRPYQPDCVRVRPSFGEGLKKLALGVGALARAILPSSLTTNKGAPVYYPQLKTGDFVFIAQPKKLTVGKVLRQEDTGLWLVEYPRPDGLPVTRCFTKDHLEYVAENFAGCRPEDYYDRYVAAHRGDLLIHQASTCDVWHFSQFDPNVPAICVDNIHRRVLRLAAESGIAISPQRLHVVYETIHVMCMSGESVAASSINRFISFAGLKQFDAHLDFLHHVGNFIFCNNISMHEPFALAHEMGHCYDPCAVIHEEDSTNLKEAFADFSAFAVTGETACPRYRDIAQRPQGYHLQKIIEDDEKLYPADKPKKYPYHRDSVYYSNIFYHLSLKYGREKMWAIFYEMRQRQAQIWTKIPRQMTQIGSESKNRAYDLAWRTREYVKIFFQTYHPDMANEVVQLLD